MAAVLGLEQLQRHLRGLDAAIFTLRAQRAAIGSPLEYAEPVHEGSPPHIIRAKNAKALYWRGASHPVRQVSHPGNKANPFFTRAMEKAHGVAVERMADGVTNAILSGQGGDAADGFRKGIYEIEAAAKGEVPVDTGALRRSLHTEFYAR
jgi:hypothetical protein